MRSESGLPPLAQMAPVALQSVVAGTTMVTSPRPCGSMSTLQRSLRRSTRLAFTTSPPVTVREWSRTVL